MKISNFLQYLLLASYSLAQLSLTINMVAGIPLSLEESISRSPLPSSCGDFSVKNGQSGLFDQLVSEQVVQFKISSKSFKLDGVTTGFRYRLTAFPSQTPIEELPTATGLPVFVTLLTENDFKFQDQPVNGISVSHPLSVFMARLPNYRETTFTLTIESFDGVIGTSIFSYQRSQQTQGLVNVPVLGEEGEIGHLSLDFLVVKPTRNWISLGGNGEKRWKELSAYRVVHSGHRGLGVGVRTDIPGYDEIPENTIASYNYASNHGADMVELDVSLTNDDAVVVYHNLRLVDVKRKETVCIRNLSYSDLLTHDYQPIEKDSSHQLSAKKTTNTDTALFPLLREVFQRVNQSTAINIEVKFPHPIDNGSWFPCTPLDIDYYVEVILEEVASFAEEREIMFSSFDPDVCTSLKLKQTRYPVFLLTKNGDYNPPTSDVRRSNIDMGMKFASASSFTGVNAYGEYILSRGRHYVDLIHRNLDLIVYVWEGPLTPDQLNQLIDDDVDGLCYDKVDLKRKDVKESGRGRKEKVI